MQSWQAPEMLPEHLHSLPLPAVLYETLNTNRSPFAMHLCLSCSRDYR
jgi:hypothetical protein